MTYPFQFKLMDSRGKLRVFTVRCRTRYATHYVDIVLTADHVRKSIKLKGVGNTQTCSMSICALDHADKFPHKVEGFIDWTYSRAAVAVTVDKKTQLPNKSVLYGHRSQIAYLNDSPEGQLKLLKILEEDGPITIRLTPIRVRDREELKKQATRATKRKLKKRNRSIKEEGETSINITTAGKKPGERTRGDLTKRLGYGAKRRFAVASLGGMAPK